jgi:A/G-specific adenine glycosylase
VNDFGNKLTAWYRQNKRDLPWRQTKDPYLIWLSEVILQQTRVEQGLHYYHKFVERFPDVFSLAEATQDEVFKLWQGLGYYNRAANLMAAAKTIADTYHGIFPEDISELLKIKGIGPYTAAAIASIAFRKKAAVVDGNVFRVLSRVFGIKTPIGSSPARKEFENLSFRLMEEHDPGEFNQSVMEFGATWCKPRNPGCADCIFNDSCFAFNNREIAHLPVRKPKNAVRNRYFFYLVIELQEDERSKIYLKKRGTRDIWRNLYDFPLIETSKPKDPLDALSASVYQPMLKSGKTKVLNISAEYRHLLTHQRIHACFIRLIVDKKINDPVLNSLILVEQNEIINYPVPRLIERYLKAQELI